MTLFYNSLQGATLRGTKRKLNLVFLISLLQFFIFSPIFGLFQEKLDKLKVVTELANIRAEPDIGSPIIHLAKQGDTMDFLGQEGPWYHIKIIINEEKIIKGYVHESLVKRLPSMTPPKEEEESKEEPEKELKPEKKEEAEVTETVTKPEKKRPSYLPKISQIHINLSGGANYSLVGDLNRGSRGFIDYYQSILNEEKTGEFQPLHLNYIAGGEVSIPLSPRLHVGIGADYFYGQKESSVEFLPPVRLSITTRPQIQIIPIRILISYHITPQFYVKSGLEYILADCTYFYKINQNNSWQEWEGKADSNQLGGILGLGYVYDLNQHFSLFMEASGRYAQVKNLEGENIQKDSNGSEYKERGTMYIYQGETPEKETFPLLFVRDKEPSGYGVSDPEKAILDLTGLSLQIGLRIKFSLFQ